jgi:hypothetical protein
MPRNTKSKPADTIETDPRQAKLDAWLDRYEAQCAWDHKLPNGTMAAGWIINARVALTMRFPHGGWDIYTGSPAADIPGTLADAEQRLGLAPEPSRAPRSSALDILDPDALVSAMDAESLAQGLSLADYAERLQAVAEAINERASQASEEAEAE